MTKAFVAVAVVVAVCVLVFTLPEMLLSLKVQTRSKVLLNIKDGNSDRDKLFRKGSVPDRFWGAPAEWNKHKKSLDLFEYLVASDDKAELARLERFCQSKTEYEKVSNGDCRALWSYQLTKQPIVGVGNMLGFWHMTKKGAFQVKFANGMNGWFKPCGGDEEFPENEVIASNLDFLLGFNRASPTVMREISLESLKEILREQSTTVPLMDHRMHILDQTEKICSQDGMLRGAMIGWWYGISDGRSFPKKINRFDDDEEVLELRQTSEPRWLAEQVKNHIFWFLIYQIRRPGKNEHVIHTIRDPKVGPEATLLAVDLDRADFTTKRKVKEMAFCFVCKIDRETYKAIKAATEFGGIGSTLRQTLLYDPTGLVRMPRKKARVVDWRLEQVRTCFDECIEKYGADDVLIDL